MSGHSRTPGDARIALACRGFASLPRNRVQRSIPLSCGPAPPETHPGVARQRLVPVARHAGGPIGASRRAAV